MVETGVSNAVGGGPMKLQWRLLIGGLIALFLGAVGADLYARVAVPYYWAVARLIAAAHQWRIVSIDVTGDSNGYGDVLQLTGAISRSAAAAQPDAVLINAIQIGAVVETPVVFWCFLALWPLRSHKERLGLLGLGIPVYLCLEAVTTVCQLVGPLAFGSAVLSGHQDTSTIWERWLRILEDGGRIVVALAAAMLVVGLWRFIQGLRTAGPEPERPHRAYSLTA